MNFKELTIRLLNESTVTPKEQRVYVEKQFNKHINRVLNRMDMELLELNNIKTEKRSKTELDIELSDAILCKVVLPKDGEYDYYGDGKVFLTFIVPVINQATINVENSLEEVEFRTVVQKSKTRLKSVTIDGREITYMGRDDYPILELFNKNKKTNIRKKYLEFKNINISSILEDKKVKKEITSMLKKQGINSTNTDINHIAKRHKVSTRQIAFLNDHTYIIFPKEGNNISKIQVILKNYDFETWAIDSNEIRNKKEEYNQYLLDEINKLASNGVLYYRSRNKNFEKVL